MMGYWSAGLMGSDIMNVSWISWYMGLCSPMYCSEISCLCWWYVWIYSCLYGNNSEALLMFLTRSWCYRRGRIRICCFGCALHKPNGVRCLIYLMCSWYLSFKLRLVCPIYDIWHVLHMMLLVLFLSITGQFWFCKLLYGIGTLKGYSCVSVLE
jgi:hypothetical protein